MRTRTLPPIDHYDEDGVVALGLLLVPGLAERHSNLLVEAARVGDFGVVRDRRGSVGRVRARHPRRSAKDAASGSEVRTRPEDRAARDVRVRRSPRVGNAGRARRRSAELRESLARRGRCVRCGRRRSRQMGDASRSCPIMTLR